MFNWGKHKTSNDFKTMDTFEHQMRLNIHKCKRYFRGKIKKKLSRTIYAATIENQLVPSHKNTNFKHYIFIFIVLIHQLMSSHK